ncbi:MAG: hypothetical protein Kow0032_22810 [Methyloligellaceae bacterium]
MITLKKAIKEGKLKQFIKERGKEEMGNLEKLDKALKRPVSRKTKEAPKASSRGNRDD